MKKITSFLMLMLMLLVCNNAQADVWVVDEEADGLIEDASQITSPYTEASEGAIEYMLDGDASTFWHSKWSGGSVDNGVHYFQVENISLPEYWGFMYTRRAVSGDQITEWSVYGVPADNMSATKEQCTFLATVETPIGSNNETLYSQAIESQGFTTVRFYEEHTGAASSGGGADRGYFHVAEFQILPCKQIADREAALSNLQTVYAAYSTYSDSFTAGDGYGQYPTDLVEAFQKALSDAEVADTPEGEDLTADQLNAMAQAIKDTYEAVAAARKPYAMAVTPGYYRIISALDFTTTVSTEETTDPVSGEVIPAETVTKHHQKAVYDNAGKAQWKDAQETAPFLWKVEATDKANTYKVTNMHNGLTFDPIKTSTAATLSATDSLMVFDWALDNVTVYADSTDESAKTVTAVNIRLAAQAERDYYYVHCGGHGGGAGVSGNIVGWCNTTNDDGTSVGASGWYLEPIDEAVAQAWIDADSPVKIITAMIDSVNAIKATYAAQKTIAIDKKSVLDTANPLITESTQFSSPYTTTDEQCDTEDEVYTYLLDGNSSTYWHSAWESGSVAGGTHYLQVELTDPSIVSNAAFVFTRRAVANDHITEWGIYGTNDSEAEKDACEKLAEISTPFSSNTETLTSDVFPTNGYKYIRFYIDNTVGSGISATRGYGHMSEFQLYPAEVGYGATTTQATARAEQMAALEAALEAFAAGNYSTTTVTDPTQADFVAAYNAVIAANNAWQAVYADPTEMREAMDAVSQLVDNMVIGTNPGEWSGESGAAAKTTLETAQVYNNSGAYTEEGLEEQTDALQSAIDAVQDAANQPATDKWYCIKFDSEASYDANGWSKTNATNETLGNLFDCVAAPSNISADDASQLEVPETIAEGQSVRFMNENDVDDEDAKAFRFVPVTIDDDTYYTIQNKKSGYFLNENGKLSLSPALFMVNAIGKGKVLVSVYDREGITIDNEDTEEPAMLHAQNAGHLLVNWSATAISSNSALLIHEITDVTGDANDPEIAINPNGMRIWYYPIAYSISQTDDNAAIYELEGRKNDNAANTVSLCFNKIDKAEAGKAYLIVAGDYTKEDDEDEGTSTVSLKVDGSQVAAAPIAYNGMYGQDAYVTNEDNAAVVVAKSHFSTNFGYKFATVEATYSYEGWPNAIEGRPADEDWNEARDGFAGSGRIVVSEAPEVTGNFDLEIVVEGLTATAIQNVVADLQKVGKIYTIDGKFLGNGNLNTVKNMGRGIYVVNGVKVAVNK